MNVKSMIISIVITYIVFSVIGIASTFLTVDMMASYFAIARPAEEAAAYAPWMYGGYFIVTVAFCYLYAKFRETGDLWEGALYGVIFGGMMSGMGMVNYAGLPFDMTALVAGIIATFVIYIVGGIVMSFVYKPE